MPEVSSVRTPPVLRRPLPVRSVNVSPLMPKDVVVAFVNRAFVANRFVLVAFVEVELMVESALIDEEAFAMSPPLNESNVDVAFPGNRYPKFE